MVQESGGKKLYLYAAAGGIAAVEAPEAEAFAAYLAAEESRLAGEAKAGPETAPVFKPYEAAIAWMSDAWYAQVVAPSPLGFGDGRVYLTAGYGAGSAMFMPEGGGAKLLWAKASDGGIASEQQTPVLDGGLLYGVMPKDAGELHGQFVCASPEGNVIWSSGKAERFGIGPYLKADGKFYILDEDGTLIAVKADAAGYSRLGSFKAIPDGVDAWAPLALAGSRLILRDSTRMRCYELGLQGGSE
jgi:outer membrane protein assembly factor BamB